MKKLTKHFFFFLSFLIIVSLAFGSKGGDDKDKKKSAKVKAVFIPLRISSPFLKNGFTYAGSLVFSTQKEKSTFSLNSLITYQRGNTTVIMPYRYRVNTAAFTILPAQNNLQLLDVKISMHK